MASQLGPCGRQPLFSPNHVGLSASRSPVARRSTRGRTSTSIPELTSLFEEQGFLPRELQAFKPIAGRVSAAALPNLPDHPAYTAAVMHRRCHHFLAQLPLETGVFLWSSSDVHVSFMAQSGLINRAINGGLKMTLRFIGSALVVGLALLLSPGAGAQTSDSTPEATTTSPDGAPAGTSPATGEPAVPAPSAETDAEDVPAVEVVQPKPKPRTTARVAQPKPKPVAKRTPPPTPPTPPPDFAERIAPIGEEFDGERDVTRHHRAHVAGARG